MSTVSTPDQVFSNLDDTKRFLNIPLSNTTADAKIDVSRDMADNYANTQIDLHELIPLATVPPTLVSYGSALAASYYNYWQSPDKTKLVGDVKLWEGKVQDYILATYARKNPNGLSGGVPFGVTSSMTGNTTGTGNTTT